MNLGENIYRLRTQMNMSQGDLADALEVSRQSVSKWENNSAVPELEKLIKMAEIFGVTLDELVSKEKVSRSETAEPQVIYIERPVQSPLSGAKIAGIILLLCAAVLAIVLAIDNYAAVDVLLLTVPLAVCGIICLFARHPGFFCGWVVAAGYWIYLFILSFRWEEQTFLILLGVAIVVVMLLWMFYNDRKEIMNIPAWGLALVSFMVVGLGILLLVNLIPLIGVTVTEFPVSPSAP